MTMPNNEPKDIVNIERDDDIEKIISLASDGDGNVAIAALRYLIRCGKVSIDDARTAVRSARDVAADAPTATAPSPDVNNGADSNRRQEIGNRKKAEVSRRPAGREKHRTRHVALHFSYDGRTFTGFAQNVGKEFDNSVEKTLFAALHKSRLLVPPEENGTLLLTAGGAITHTELEPAGRPEGGKAERGGSEAEPPPSARTSSQYSRCGRTDRGVHANGQVVALYLKSAFPLSARRADDGDGDSLGQESLPKNSLDGLDCLVPPRKSRGNGEAAKESVRKTITEYDYPRILNNLLPPSVRVLGWCPVSPEFSARFSCSRRTYRYFFPRRELDLPAMAQGLLYMMGRHDFRNLCKMNCQQVYNFERVLFSGRVVTPQKVHVLTIEENQLTPLSIQELDGESSAPPSPRDICHVEIVGQAFLWHQIRCIMSILFYIGRKLEPPALVQQMLDVETNPAKPSYEMASETALVLQSCEFARLDLGRTVRNLWNVTKALEQRWEEHAVAAERARDALESIRGETLVRWTDVAEFAEQIVRDRRRKEQKRRGLATCNDNGDVRKSLEERSPGKTMMGWGCAVDVIRDVVGVHPHVPNGIGKGHTESTVHVPLMERSKGTTYEEKVRAILGEGKGASASRGKSSKRRDRYEENVIKKRKTAAEDKAFYNHMLQQGTT